MLSENKCKYTLNSLLRQKYLTQKEQTEGMRVIANKVGVDFKTLRNWTYIRIDQKAEIRTEYLLKLSRVLSVNVDDMITSQYKQHIYGQIENSPQS